MVYNRIRIAFSESDMDSIIRQERIEMEAGKSITVGTHTVEYNHPLHWHSFFEIEIILSGEGKYVVNDVEYDISDTNVFLLTSTDFHYLKVDGVAKIINISFDETMMSDSDMTSLVFDNVKKGYRFGSEEYARIVAVAEVLRHECEVDGDCRRSLLKYIIRCLLRKNGEPSGADMSDQSLAGIRRAIVFMELHFREGITLTEVATEAGYTPTYFSKLFKKATGKTYIEMLTRYRLGCSRTLLANGFSVSESCFSSGFGSITTFFEAFKREYNMSPSEYKKNAIANR